MIRNKFQIEYRALIIYYSQQLRQEIKEQEKIEEQRKQIR